MIDQAEQQEVANISNQYFLQEIGSQEAADDAMVKWATMVQ